MSSFFFFGFFFEGGGRALGAAAAATGGLGCLRGRGLAAVDERATRRRAAAAATAATAAAAAAFALLLLLLLMLFLALVLLPWLLGRAGQRRRPILKERIGRYEGERGRKVSFPLSALLFEKERETKNEKSEQRFCFSFAKRIS